MSNSAHDQTSDLSAEIAHEQQHITMLYGELDKLRKYTSDRLAGVLMETGGTPQARTERDVATAMYSERLAQLDAVDSGLCFGRLDFDDGAHTHIGRIGLFDEQNSYEPLLMDWRAPAARPFYLATAANRDGVRRRRHIRTKRYEVVGLDDEVLDLDAVDTSRHEGLAGEAALLAALNAGRTGSMSDIVATIQREQDRIIRSALNGVLVVQGGPGTGKTAVALHRVAYLLYTFRRQLAKRGVLVVGPNSTFLRYIGQVLPSLGETGVLLSTVGQLYPGLDATASEPVTTATVKGSRDMVEVIAAAVRNRQEVPRGAVELTFEREPLMLTRQICVQARTSARRSRRPHNLARQIFVKEVIAALAEEVAARVGRDLLDPGDLREIRDELRADDAIMSAIDALWPKLTPQRLLGDLFSSPKRLAAAARRLPAEQRELLARDADAPWTPADVPLLDEAAELLGTDDAEQKAAEARRRKAELDYARGVLDILELADDADPDVLMATDVLDAHRLAERHEAHTYQTAAERAAQDRTWTFGHVVVDEAQELSPMAWRVIMRRCPSRSMTIVGDIAQTGAPGGAPSWQDALGPYVARRWRLEELTVNYRTPAEIMAVAADVLAAIDERRSAPDSVRTTGVEPWLRRVDPAELAGALPGLVSEQLAEVGDGNLAVLASGRLVGSVSAALPERPERVSVLSVEQAKGLEFDAVLVVDPDGIIRESPRGYNDLYVALTRATKRLGVVSTTEVPAVLGGLAGAAHVAA